MRFKQISTVLVIETDTLFRRSLVERLRLEGHMVFEAGEEVGAEKLVHAKNVDVVLLGLGGLQRRALGILKKIKERRPTTEVILMSPADYHSLPLSMEGMRLGAFDEVLAPFDTEALMERIRQAREQKKGKLEANRSVDADGKQTD